MLKVIISLTRPYVRLPAYIFQRRLSAEPDFESDYIQVEMFDSAGVITLNRPRAMNSINASMMRKIYRALADIEKNKKILIIKGIPNYFSSGGDLVSLLGNVPINTLVKMPPSTSRPFIYAEYYVFQFLNSYKIPYVALIDGICMGAGLGIAMNARYRVATERTLVAMPENKFGYFTDAGASYFLPRLPRNLGIYLGITGDSLKGSNIYKAGLASQYVNSQKLPALVASLVKCTNNFEIEASLNKYTEWVDSGAPIVENMDDIEKCFIPDTIENIIERLETIKNDWSRKVLKKMQTLSPGSMKLTLRALQQGANLNYEDCLHMEFRIVENTAELNYDIVNGIRELFVNKNKVVKWNPATLAEVDDAYVERYFQRPPPQYELLFRY